jgi:hypothetical protein
MILTPKNWKSFQHYKDRSPAWIKLHKALLDDYEFACLPVASKALAPLLWLLASEYEDGKIDATLDKLAFRLHMTRGDLANALSPLVEKGFFDASEALAERKQDACLEKEEEKEEEREEEREGEKRKNSRSASPSSEDFENLRRVYPRRKGNYGWAKAEKKFNSLVKTGVDAKVILAAARQLAETLGSKIGTEFVPMPASWLNSEDFVSAAVSSFDEPKPIDWDNIVSFYARTRHWSRDAGPDPDSPACQAPPEVLRKHGIQPTGASHG